jgi:putative PIN family toxin of toxin-antitoxin system
MKIFLDTNVIVSAVATRGLCADVLRETLRSHQLVISEYLINEVRHVLQKKIRVPGELADDLIEILKQDAILSIPESTPDVPVEDKNDLLMLSSALAGKADLFVTGDGELLKLAKIEKLEIVSPRRFWEKLRLTPQRRFQKT